jgi:hypothetical protein
VSPPSWLYWPAAATGLSLIIHDTFSGSGSIVGRTPDTVNNGSTWEVLEPDTAFTVSSGGVQRTGKSSSGADPYFDNCVIDIGTTGPFRIEIIVDYVALASNGFGIAIWDTSGSLDNSTASRCGYNANEHMIQEIIAGVAQTILVSDPGKFTQTNQTLYNHLEFDGSTLTSTLFDSSMTQISQISTSSYTRTPSVKCGITFGSTSIVSTAVTDFKVYA